MVSRNMASIAAIMPAAYSFWLNVLSICSDSMLRKRGHGTSQRDNLLLDAGIFAVIAKFRLG
jgi:hypothetical protein